MLYKALSKADSYKQKLFKQHSMDQDPKSWPAMAGYCLLLFLCLCQSWPTVNCQHTWQEAFKALGISYNPDGTLNRQIQIPMVNATPSVDPTMPTPVALSSDVRISALSKAFVRLYRPVNPPANTKLPLIIYLHGGDFVLYSASTVIFHDFCNNIAAQFPAVIVSVEYRLAPENRLPAAYDDALNAIFWVQSQAIGYFGRHPWFQYADFSRVFLLGSSAGANIVYHTALRVLDFNLQPLRIRGVLLNQAFFGGIQSTPSELRLVDDPYVPLYVCDVLWQLALPTYANKDHEFCNPLTGGSYLGRVPRLPKFFVKGDEGDPLVDRSKQLVQLLQSYRVPVVSQFNQGGYHGIELSNTTAAQQLYTAMKNFVYSTGLTEDENSQASM
ncbi:probable carboxylesterase 8 [Olea europaea subsp. europaea]|uniref:Probable carboxylesterase 8 n=2 Tax=Olea europaea subsp. europaea TaxID=158383 RepID=A0A8S0T015_OLEEU|nr:probable carboxylesterase 8 [Olea europaea subsp. europaea]